MQLDFRATKEASLIRKMRELSNRTGQMLGSIIKNTTMMSARYLADSTQPVSLGDDGAKGLEQGRNKVAGDLKRVYVTAAGPYKKMLSFGAPVAKAYWRHMKRGEFEKARAILTRMGMAERTMDMIAWDMGQRHQAKRRRGIVPRNNRPALTVVQSKTIIPKYVKAIQKRVGLAKASWISAARQITSYGIGQVRLAALKQFSLGTGTDSTNNKVYPHIILESNLRYSDIVCTPRYYTRALDRIRNSIVENIEKKIYYITKERMLNA